MFKLLKICKRIVVVAAVLSAVSPLAVSLGAGDLAANPCPNNKCR